MARGAKHNDAERHAFWNRVEERLGTAVLGHGLGRYLSGEADPGPLYGLLYCTADALYFHHFAQASWFSAFTANSAGNDDAPRPAREREIEYRIEFALCEQLQQPAPATRLQRWFGRHDAVYCLIRTGLGATAFVFSVDHRRNEFADALVTAFDRAGGPATDTGRP